MASINNYNLVKKEFEKNKTDGGFYSFLSKGDIYKKNKKIGEITIQNKGEMFPFFEYVLGGETWKEEIAETVLFFKETFPLLYMNKNNGLSPEETLALILLDLQSMEESVSDKKESDGIALYKAKENGVIIESFSYGEKENVRKSIKDSVLSQGENFDDEKLGYFDDFNF